MRPRMTSDPDIMHRPSPPWWPETWAPLAAFAVAYVMGWGTWVAIGAAVAAGIIAFMVRPRLRRRRPWTE
jgi:hypothetical protein